MRTFFRIIRNIFLLAVLAFAVWSYKNDPNMRMATQDSLTTLNYRIQQLLKNGTTTPPKLGDKDTSTRTDKTKDEHLPLINVQLLDYKL